MIYIVSTVILTLITCFLEDQFSHKLDYLNGGDFLCPVRQLGVGDRLVDTARRLGHACICSDITLMQVIMGTIVSATITLSVYVMFGFLEV